jgi:hypothetical protein
LTGLHNQSSNGRELQVITANIVGSPDGKKRTVTQAGKDAQGRDLNIVSVYEKQ